MPENKLIAPVSAVSGPVSGNFYLFLLFFIFCSSADNKDIQCIEDCCKVNDNNNICNQFKIDDKNPFSNLYVCENKRRTSLDVIQISTNKCMPANDGGYNYCCRY